MSPPDPLLRIVDASSGPRLDLAKELFGGYAREWSATIGPTLSVQGFEAELAALPGRYAPPSGRLLVALRDGEPAGCVGLRDLGEGTCEMKRLYVPAGSRGRGVGSALVEAVLREAEAMGCRRMVLDTLPEMLGAIALYRAFGFAATSPYWDHPVPEAIFLERSLNPDADSRPMPTPTLPLAQVVQDDMAAYFEHLAARVDRLARALGPDELWDRPFPFGNSVGRIVVHLTGNLDHYIGARVAGTDYLRDRDDEFRNPATPDVEALLVPFHRAVALVLATLRAQGECGLMSPVHDCGEPVRDRFGLFLVCLAHLNNHVGQIVYLVQAHGHALDEMAW